MSVVQGAGSEKGEAEDSRYAALPLPLSYISPFLFLASCSRHFPFVSIFEADFPLSFSLFTSLAPSLFFLFLHSPRRDPPRRRAYEEATREQPLHPATSTSFSVLLTDDELARENG
jgi:hypothetical protein